MNNSLYEVVTVQEAAELFHVIPDTIRYHINRGHLRWRKSHRVYLISLASLIELYGTPVKTPAIWVQHPN